MESPFGTTPVQPAPSPGTWLRSTLVSSYTSKLWPTNPMPFTKRRTFEQFQFQFHTSSTERRCEKRLIKTKKHGGNWFPGSIGLSAGVMSYHWQNWSLFDHTSISELQICREQQRRDAVLRDKATRWSSEKDERERGTLSNCCYWINERRAAQNVTCTCVRIRGGHIGIIGERWARTPIEACMRSAFFFFSNESAVFWVFLRF